MQRKRLLILNHARTGANTMRTVIQHASGCMHMHDNIVVEAHEQQLALAARQESAEEFAAQQQMSFCLAATAFGCQKHRCKPHRQ